MSVSGYKLIDRRSSTGWTNNRLIDAATPRPDRPTPPPLDNDTHRNINAFGRITLANAGKYLFDNCPAVRGAVKEMAEAAGSTFEVHYVGRNEEWGRLMQDKLYEHDKILCLNGPPFDFAAYRRMLIYSVFREGDMLTVLVDQGNGYPMIQMIPSHRIRCAANETNVQGGDLDGARIIDGVIVNDYGRALAYRVCSESRYDKDNFTDISANDAFLSFIPEYPDQVRGWSQLGACLFDFQDLNSARRYQLTRHMLAASMGFIEHTEGGNAEASTLLDLPDSPTPIQAGVRQSIVNGVTSRIVRAGSDSKIEAIEDNRPTPSERDLREDVLREALYSLNWSVDFGFGAVKLNGGNLRLLVDRINRTVQCLQYTTLIPATQRINVWRISKFVKLGTLPPDDDFYELDYQGPARFTPDAGYDEQIDREALKMGGQTYRNWYGKKNLWWQEQIRQRIKEQRFIQDEAKAEGVNPDKIQLLGNEPQALRQEANGSAPSQASAAASQPVNITLKAPLPEGKRMARKVDYRRNDSGEILGFNVEENLIEK